MRKWYRQATAALAAGLLAGCASGIDYARVGNRYYEATPPLSDGSGNPPPGWGNPYQPGTMTVISPTQAVFTDKAGHRVVFTLVPSGGPGRTTAPVCA